MKRRKFGLAIGIFCICLAIVAVYNIMVMTGFFENKDIVDEIRHISSENNLATGQITLTWDPVPDATSYNLYWSFSPGITKKSGNKMVNVKNPVTITKLKRGATYYFAVTAVNGSVESEESEELAYTVGR